MKVAQLRSALKSFEDIYRKTGDKDAADALSCFANLLRGHDTKTVAAFTKLVKARQQKSDR